MKTRILSIATIFAFSVLLSGCDGNAVFEEKKDGFEHNRWEKSRSLDFSVDIQKTGVYSFDIFFSHIYGYQFPQIPLVLEVKYPDGHVEKDNVVVQLKDEKGNDSGDCAGDYCDLWHTVQPPRALQPGNYKIKLSNEFKGQFLPNVLGAGLKVSLQK